jgi:hypothetical protein
MAKYRMDIFKPGRKPGHPAPLLWRRRDIYAADDAAAKAVADDLFCTHASQQTLTNFYLCDSGGRTIYESLGQVGSTDTPRTARRQASPLRTVTGRRA